MDTLPAIHDTFIRAILADTALAQAWFENSLPDFVREKLDFTSLTQLPDTYVSKELQKTVSDIVYTCQRKDRQGQVKISLLVEHKSSPYRYTPIQIGSYIFSAWLKQIANREEPSLVIPVLLYHGKQKWEYRTLSDIFPKPDPEFRQFIPDYQYIYHHLGVIPDQELEVLDNKLLKACLLALKHAFDKPWLEENAARLLLWLEGENRNLQSEFIVYYFKRSGLKENRIIEIIEELPLEIKNTIMSTADIFIEKGKKIGRLEGREEERKRMVQNLLQLSQLTDEQIAAAAEVETAYVSNLRKELDNQ